MMKFFDLPWEDVICNHIFNVIQLKQVCRLKRVSKTMKDLVALYLDKYCRHYDDRNEAHRRLLKDVFFFKTNLLSISFSDKGSYDKTKDETTIMD